MAERHSDSIGRGRVDPFGGRRARVGVDCHLERRAQGREAQRQPIGYQSADQGGDERARPALGRGSVPKRIEKAGRRGRSDSDDIGRDQSDGMAKQGGDQDQKRDRVGRDRRLEHHGKGNEHRPADSRAQSREQRDDADHWDKKWARRLAHRSIILPEFRVTAPAPSSRREPGSRSEHLVRAEPKSWRPRRRLADGRSRGRRGRESRPRPPS